MQEMKLLMENEVNRGREGNFLRERFKTAILGNGKENTL
jgi:hypothetical protein